MGHPKLGEWPMQGKATSQGDLKMLKAWADSIVMRFNMKMSCIWHRKKKKKHALAQVTGKWLESNFTENCLGSMVNKKQGAPEAKEVKFILGCISKVHTSKIIPLYSKTISGVMSPHYTHQFWTPLYKTDTDSLTHSP